MDIARLNKINQLRQIKGKPPLTLKHLKTIQSKQKMSDRQFATWVDSSPLDELMAFMATIDTSSWNSVDSSSDTSYDTSTTYESSYDSGSSYSSDSGSFSSSE